MWRERKEQSSQELRIASAATPTNRPDQSFTARTAPHRTMRALPMAAGRAAAVAACASPAVPRRSLLLSTAAAGEPPCRPPADSSSPSKFSRFDRSAVRLLGWTAALQPEPVRLTRGASAAPKLRASPPDAAQAATAAAAFGSKEEAFAWAKSDNRRLLHVVYRVGDIDRTIK